METKIYPIEKLGDLNLQKLYSRTTVWLDELDFCESEVQFFKKVLELYILKSDAVAKSRIEQKQSELFDLQIDKHVIEAEVATHREVVELLIKNLISQKEEDLREKHEDLESRISLLNQSFMNFKINLFKLTEEIIDTRSGYN